MDIRSTRMGLTVKGRSIPRSWTEDVYNNNFEISCVLFSREIIRRKIKFTYIVRITQ